MRQKLQGVILAGGASSRFGSPKAFAEIDGMPFYRYSIEALKPFVTSLLIVTNPKLEHLFKEEMEDLNVVTDVAKYTGQGPLAGIYTAMETISAEWYVVIPVDVPFMEPEVIGELVRYIDAGVEAVIPTVSGNLQPLISIYHYTTIDTIKSLLDDGKRAVYHLLNACQVAYVPIDSDKPFTNVNHRSDYLKLIEGKDNSD